MKAKGLEVSDLKNAMLVGTFFFLWLAVYFSDRVEQALAFILIFTFGILHGANDLEILRRKTRTSLRHPGTALLAGYVGFVLLSAGLFYLVPPAALAFFLMFSAYHFGEQHWIRREGRSARVQKVLYLAYGTLVLCMLFEAHPAEVGAVVLEITGYAVPVSLYPRGAAGALVVFVATLALNFQWPQFRNYMLRELFLLGVFFVVFHTASLIWAFAIYFVVWHSIPSLADQIRLLYGPLSLSNGKKYLKASAVYWVGALAALAVAFLWTREGDYGLLPLFFSFLAAITFPHVLVIARLYRA